MTVTEQEKCIYGNGVQVVSREDDCTVYSLEDENGDARMTCYHVFPGIDLVYNDVHMQRSGMKPAVHGNFLEINHCREGRVECECAEQFYYLSAGDLSIQRRDGYGHASYYPLSHYHGISILIDADHAPMCLSCFLKDVNVQPTALIQKFCKNAASYVVRSQPGLAHIFSELYDVPDSIRKGYFKVKILELLLFLSSMDITDDELKQRSYSGIQVTLAKDAGKYLSEHMNRRITIDELAERFYVSPTQLKNSFKGVYGVSIYAYTRAQKMQAAACALRQSDDTIMQIAGRYGYENPSKFAKAFKDVVGMTPNEYRNSN
ncbi:MAG: AraC family transcriptional regulator [Clostridia bacterium]|nr:AraC family transcriptional regulator [Clostridia bacterium]